MVKTKKNTKTRQVLLPFIVSFLTTLTLLVVIIPLFNQKNNNQKQSIVIGEKIRVSKDMIKDIIEFENNIYIDPLDLIIAIDKKQPNIKIVDLRSHESYKKGHIITAINRDYQDIIKDKSQYKKQLIILYSHTSYSVDRKQIALKLIEQGFNVRILSIGWNEFRHFRNLWIPEDKWDKIDINKYVTN